MEYEGRVVSLPNVHRLYGDEDSYRLTARQVRLKPVYELSEDGQSLTIDDPIWNSAEIGDQPGDELIIKLYNHPLVQRLVDVEQLTLPIRYSTLPGSTDLTRWEHAWGSLILARKLANKAEAKDRRFTDKDKLVFQLRTFLSDLGHTAFSHLGDWLLQGFGGSEDQHDSALLNLLEIGGVADLLKECGIELSEVVGTGKPDWVEAPSPDLCVDRVDFGLREISRWIDPYPYSHLNNPIDHFSLSGEKLVMTSKEAASFFGVGFGLLATEHWSHPVHRLQLHLFAILTKGAILENGSPVLDRYGIRHPADFLYTTDSDIHESMRMVGELNNDLHAIMLDLARDQRRVFAWGREQEIYDFVSRVADGKNDIMYDKTVDFLHPLESRTWQGRYAGVKPPNIEFVPVQEWSEVKNFGKNTSTLDIFLPSLKLRSIDPLFVRPSGRLARLSSSDKHFARLLEQHKTIQAQAYVARVHLAPDFATELKLKIAKVEQAWERRFQASRADLQTVKKAIGDIAWHAALGRRYS